jgi:hypothetical protein
VCAVLSALTACASRPAVLNIPVAVVRTSKDTVTDNDVRDAVVRAAAGVGWKIRDESGGKLVATRTEDSQTAVVTVNYHMSMYSIRYRDSRNLKYGRRSRGDLAGSIVDPDYATIDKKYNEWVRNLDQAIQTELASLR